ncbi:DUF397 domain-containing protein [Streptomyces albus subsp. chlorinus]|uniref:DUF397 domain-containing protein n=1 Tax=Streptomyces albus TaxID=1888 RepID=UPI00156F69C7|nr:DUF397 domain-containing protein [Streptomyces albus]NSC24666.1 DUF397 domain-containing protein [Streptomyces albus subsp. chlorinus]
MTRATSLPVSAWRKSSYSGQGGGNCLEVADGCPGPHVPVRDSKNPEGPALLIPHGAWCAFVSQVRQGTL